MLPARIGYSSIFHFLPSCVRVGVTKLFIVWTHNALHNRDEVYSTRKMQNICKADTSFCEAACTWGEGIDSDTINRARGRDGSSIIL